MKKYWLSRTLLVARIGAVALMWLPGFIEAASDNGTGIGIGKGISQFALDKSTSKEAESVLAGYWNLVATYGIYGSLFAAAFFAFVLRKTDWVVWAIGAWFFFALGDDVAKWIAKMGGWKV